MSNHQEKPKQNTAELVIKNKNDNAKSMAQSIQDQHPLNTPQAGQMRRPRPIRPNLRRQAMVGTSDTRTNLLDVGSLAVADATSLVIPPRRPAQLPASYATLSNRYLTRSQGPIVGRLDPAQASNQPANRYAWVQLKHHPSWQLDRKPENLNDPNSQGHLFQHLASPLSTAASRVLVVNPMQIVNLSEHTKSRLVKFIEAVKHLSEKWFSHVLLLLFLAVYACLGAYIFISFEATTEESEKQYIIETRSKLVNDSWAQAHNVEQSEYFDLFQGRLLEYERVLYRACASGMTSSSTENQWTFWGALFYSMTVFTTIGYGHLTPITFAGRVATMIYAIFGIPILLMVLADLGKLLTRIIKFAFKQSRNLYNKCMNRKSSLRTRKMISDNTNQYIGVAREALERGVAYMQPYNDRFTRVLRVGSVRGRNASKPDSTQISIDETEIYYDLPKYQELGARMASSPSEDQTEAPIDQLISTDIIVTPVKQTKPVSPPPSSHKNHPLIHQPSKKGDHRKRKSSSSSFIGSSKAKSNQNLTKESISRSASSSQLNQSGTEIQTGSLELNDPERSQESCVTKFEEHDRLTEYEDAEEELEEEELDIPVSFALFLLVTYMMFGAVVFSIWEGWNFFDSLYFVFISMSTIGFGDLVPQHPKRMIGTFIYLLFGLALTSMCINVVQEKIHATFLKAKMQIGEKMGLDLDQIMADDYYDGGQNGDVSDGADEDSQSVDMSQANSSVGQHDKTEGSNQVVKSSLSTEEAGEPSPSKGSGVRLSKSSPSLRSSRRRGQASLPAHANQSGLIWRKSTRRGQNSSKPANGGSSGLSPSPSSPSQTPTQSTTQTTPTIALPVVTAPSPVSPEDSPTPEPPTNQCTLEVPQESSIRPEQEPEPNPEPETEKPDAVESSNHVQQVDPPSSKPPSFRPKFSTAQSQPTVVGSQHSLMSQDSQASYKTPANSSSPQSNNLSVNASRRASVSHELSQLDELITTLQAQSSSDRYGPLLGIPKRASERSSLSNSPKTQRRAFSTINRPTIKPLLDANQNMRQVSLPRAQNFTGSFKQAYNTPRLGENDRGVAELASGTLAMKPTSKSLSGSHAALEDALKAIQSSAM